MHSLPLLGLGVFFVLAGFGLFAFTLRKQPAMPVPAKKTDLRAQEALKTETAKIRIAAGVAVVLGAVMIAIF